MDLRIFSGSASRSLGDALLGELSLAPGRLILERFPDGEIHADVREEVRGRDVFLVQSCAPPVGENLLELLLLSDACRRAGAERLTAVVPYFGYARHDRRLREGQPLAARLVADMLTVGHFARVITVDLHDGALEACFSSPVEHLTAVPFLVQALRPRAKADSIVVAPDLGAAKLAHQVARMLHLPMAMIHKTRLSGSDVVAQGVTGDVRERRPIIVDDLIATGATVAAAYEALVQRGCVPSLIVATTHALLVGPAVQRFAALPIELLVATDSLPLPPDLPFPAEVVSLAPLLSEAIRRLAGGGSLRALSEVA